jgi:UDP-glucose 4-epimerase
VRVLVTGGAGFIGHHLVGGLVARGHDVSVIDDFSSGYRWRLAPFDGRIAITTGSILDPRLLGRAAEGCEVIYHLAANVSVAQSSVAPRSTNDVNAGGTIETMLAASRHRVRRVVFAGSSAVYGATESLPSAELLRPAPQSPYGVSKLAAEHYVHTLGELHGLETVVLRFFNVFGPGQDPAAEYAAVVPRFVTAVLGGGVPIVNGDGGITRDFVYVDNVVEANLLASLPSIPSGLTCNIASGGRTSLLDLLGAICKAAGRNVDPAFGPPRPGDIRHSQADISLAQSSLGYRVGISFDEGIARTVAWYRDPTEHFGLR